MKIVALMRELVSKGMSWEDAAMFAEKFETGIEEAIERVRPQRADGTGAERTRRYRSRMSALGMSQTDWAAKSAEIIERDGYACTYCGTSADRMVCDHIQPISRAGTNHDTNLTTACNACNGGKADKTLEEWKGEEWAANWRASRVTVTRHRDKKEVPPTPPSENTPFPPLKGGTSPTISASQPEKPKLKPLSAWVAEIWEITPRPGRERSGRRDLENTLKAAERRGADLAAVMAGVAGYYASPDATKDHGQFAKGVHVVVSSGRWEAFAESDAVPELGDDDPWPSRLTRWRKAGYWNSEWGPKPGKPGYRGPEIEGIAA